MPHYRITFSRSGRSARGAPVLWFVPMPKDMFPKREVVLMEAPGARDAITAFVKRENVAVDLERPVRGSPLLHGWFLSGKTTIAEYIDSFVGGRRRSLSFNAPNDVRFRILSIAEEPEPASGIAGTDGYQQPFASLEGRPATSD
ncbi:MAG: hypothetical protein WEE64_01320 [Dehalococcoidia bacterium]